jgi:hypothetical protein
VGRLVPLVAILSLVASLAACGGVTISADQAYFVHHELDPRVQACLPFPGSLQARERWVKQMALREMKRMRRLTHHDKNAGTQRVGTTAYAKAISAPQLHRAVLCMRERLARR